MEFLKPFFADGLLKALALVNAARSNEAFKKEECMLVECYCILTNGGVRLVSVAVVEDDGKT